MRVVIHGLTKEFTTGKGKLRALAGVDLEVRDQEFFGIIGPTGTTEVHPEWTRLEVPFAQVLKPSDLGRIGQDPLASTTAATSVSDELVALETTLPNGLRVYLKPSRANTTIAGNREGRVGELGFQRHRQPHRAHAPQGDHDPQRRGDRETPR